MDPVGFLDILTLSVGMSFGPRNRDNSDIASRNRSHSVQNTPTPIVDTCIRWPCNINIYTHYDLRQPVALNLKTYGPFVWGIHWSPVNSPHKGQWRGALVFSLICAWINGWANTLNAGDLREREREREREKERGRERREERRYRGEVSRETERRFKIDNINRIPVVSCWCYWYYIQEYIPSPRNSSKYMIRDIFENHSNKHVEKYVFVCQTDYAKSPTRTTMRRGGKWCAIFYNNTHSVP